MSEKAVYLSPPNLAMVARVTKFIEYIIKEVEAGKIESLEELNNNFEHHVEESLLYTHGNVNTRYKQVQPKYLSHLKAKIDRNGERIFRDSKRQQLKSEIPELKREIQQQKAQIQQLKDIIEQQASELDTLRQKK